MFMLCYVMLECVVCGVCVVAEASLTFSEICVELSKFFCGRPRTDMDIGRDGLLCCELS